MRMKKASASLIALLVLLGASPARAIDPRAGTGGASFMKIGIGGARAMALGRSFVALGEGSDAIPYNPAGLALAQQREASYSYLRYVQEISSPFYMAYAHPLGRTVIGANMAYISVDGFDVRDANGVALDNTNVRVQDGFATLSVARSFWYEKLFLGGSMKGIHEDNDGTVHDVIVGDVGVLLKPNQYVTFGLAQQNFGASTSQVATMTRAGAAMRFFEMLNATIEVSKASDNAARVGLGAEFVLPEDFLQFGQVALRAGYYSSDDMGRVLEEDRHFLFPLVGSPKLSFGIGLMSSQLFGYSVSFDYALMSLGALGTVDQLSLRVRF